MEESRKPLDVPINAPDRDDYIQGIGRKEITYIGLALVVALITAIIIYGISQNMLTAIGTAFFIIVFIVGVVKRDIYNETVIDKCRIIFRYMRMQKEYRYVQYDFLEVAEDGKQIAGNVS